MLLTLAALSCNTPNSRNNPSVTDIEAGPPPRPYEAGEPVSPLPPVPDTVPKGWRLLTEYDTSCGLYVPSTAEHLPAPIRWEPCANSTLDAGISGPPGMSCQQAASDWQPNPSKLSQVFLAATTLPTGKVIVIQRRILGPDTFMDVIADIDGPVHAAILSTGPCFLSDAGLNSTGYLFQVKPWNRDSGLGGGVLAGDLQTFHPRVVLPVGYAPQSGPYTPTFIAGATTFVEQLGGPDSLRSLSTGARLRPIDMPETGLRASHYQFLSDTLFFRANSSQHSIIAALPPNSSTRTIIGNHADKNLFNAAFSTDGIDMVWVQARRETNTASFEIASATLWTAKYVLNASTAENNKRQLRPLQAQMWDSRRVVGCGYDAGRAHGHLQPWAQFGFTVTRLRDGQTWTVLSNSEEQTASFRLAQPLLITCSEILVEAFRGSYGFMTRIRLDSLTADPAPPSP